MSQRHEFVMLARADGGDGDGGVNLSLLCRRFGISRKCGYKWMARFAAGGVEALQDRSRRPLHSPTRSGEDVERRVAVARGRHPAWGPRKLRRLLVNEGNGDPAALLPAASTIGQILRRRGLIDPADSGKHRAFVRFERPAPNELWQMDFKGHVAMLDGRRCHPLTVLDDHSRFNVGLLACGDERTETVRLALVKLLERYGQPACILCDNGGPWGSAGGRDGGPYTRLGVC